MDFTPIFNAAAVLVAAIITAVIVPYIKTKTEAINDEQLVKWVNMAVAAAEQTHTGKGKGEAKKDFALEVLADVGVKIDTPVQAAIEAAVYKLKKDDEQTA